MKRGHPRDFLALRAGTNCCTGTDKCEEPQWYTIKDLGQRISGSGDQRLWWCCEELHFSQCAVCAKLQCEFEECELSGIYRVTLQFCGKCVTSTGSRCGTLTCEAAWPVFFLECKIRRNPISLVKKTIRDTSDANLWHQWLRHVN